MNLFAPPSTALPPPTEPGRSIRPMSVLAAAGWAVLTVLLSISLASLLAAAFPIGPSRLHVLQFVSAFGCQLVATLLALVLIHRTYTPHIPIRELVGVRA